MAMTQALTMERFIDATRERVFEAWTRCEDVVHWLSPQGFTVPACEIDLRVGGKFISCMRSPDGQDYWGTGVYREISPPERLVYTDNFADEEGNVVPASHYGMGDDIPLEMLVTVTFEEDSGGTRVSLRHESVPPGEHYDDMRQGWNECLDKLEDYLADEM